MIALALLAATALAPADPATPRCDDQGAPPARADTAAQPPSGQAPRAGGGGTGQCQVSGGGLPSDEGRGGSAPDSATARAAPRRGDPAHSPSPSVARSDNPFSHGENMAVQDRPHPDWDPLGIRVGGFILFPKVEFDAAFDDNVFATPNQIKGDAIFTATPGFSITSDWNQNEVGLTAEGIFRQYATYPSQNTDEYSVKADARLDVFHDETITSEASESRAFIPRSSDFYARESLTPLYLDTTAFQLRGVKTFNFLNFSAAFNFNDLRYGNGVTFDGKPLDEAFLDKRIYSTALRADYAVSPKVDFFVEETVGYSDLSSIFRSRVSTQTLFGPNFELSHLITGEIGVGYLTSDYGSPLAKSVGNFTYRVKIRYYPTQLMTVTLSGQQSTVDSGLPNSPYYDSKTVGLELDYELLRNLLITGQFTTIWNRYQNVDRQDVTIHSSLTAKYKVSHTVAFSLTAISQHRQSSGAAAGLGLDENIVSLGVVLQR